MAGRWTPGRKHKLTPQTAEIIIESIREGAFISTAAAAARIPPRTIRKWLQDGKRGKTAFLYEFWISVEQARAEAEINDQRAMKDPNSGLPWQVFAWRLERRNWRHWCSKTPSKKERDTKPEVTKPLQDVEKEINAALASITGLPQKPTGP